MTKPRPWSSELAKRAAALACGLLLILASPLAGATPAAGAGHHRKHPPATHHPTKHSSAKHRRAARPPAPELGPAEALDDDGAPGLRGTASFYGGRFAGRPTSTGESFDTRQFTAASNRFPLGSTVAVQRVDNGRCAIVRVNDRMRAGRHRRRVIDVSRGVAEYLGMIRAGVVMVRVAALPGDGEDGGPAACAAAFDPPAPPCEACGQPENLPENGASSAD